MKQTFIFAKPFLHEPNDCIEAAHLSTEAATIFKKDLRAKEIPQGALLITDHPARLGRNFDKVLAQIAAVLRRQCEIKIGDIAIKPASSEAQLLIQLFDMKNKIKNIRIKEGLWLTKKRGVPIGRRRVDRDMVETFKQAKKDQGSFRSASKQLQDQGIEISKSTLHSILRKRR